ncbi:MAG: thioredoxin family protein [Methylotenera sp.]|nr:thioredoxin family protein [Methylotenera sp.]
MNQDNQINRLGLDKLKGASMIEFGATWCGYCQAAQPLITEALAHCPLVTHIKIEDGKGQQLGRTYEVKLWPTLIFLNDGTEVMRLVRPTDTQVISDALSKLT